METVCSFEMLLNFCQNTRRHKSQGKTTPCELKGHRLKGLEMHTQRVGRNSRVETLNADCGGDDDDDDDEPHDM